ncbi:uncharacterized protein RCO7_14408 [Rhynchosporium graminicola]|uniref:Uncharacterized protein n=1 Tax=Rhynchosporium graminicola TaxID=2792576 RepID=A0A1E1KDU2_9HELO|nr:uncharacterized protein RCO7_14408 [Rhynchosporium commune]
MAFIVEVCRNGESGLALLLPLRQVLSEMSTNIPISPYVPYIDTKLPSSELPGLKSKHFANLETPAPRPKVWGLPGSRAWRHVWRHREAFDQKPLSPLLALNVPLPPDHCHF